MALPLVAYGFRVIGRGGRILGGRRRGAGHAAAGFAVSRENIGGMTQQSTDLIFP